jgi:phage-related protein
MRSLSSTLLIEKNRLASPYPWVPLVQFNFTGATGYLAANTENVTYQTRTYTAFHLEVELPVDEISQSIPECKIRAANESRAFQTFIESSGGGVDVSVIITIVNTNNLAADYSNLTWSFNIMQVDCDNHYVTMMCTKYSPITKRFPHERFYGRTCRYRVFKGPECKYAGGTTTCDRTLDTCTTLANTVNFGGFPGIIDPTVAFLLKTRI